MRGLALTPVLVLAVSCASLRTPEVAQVVEIPARWTSPSNPEAVDQGWWLSFGNRSLQLVMEESLQHNHDLKAAVARLDAAMAQGRISGANLFPHADFTFDSQRRQQNFVGLPIPGAGNQVLTSRSTTHGMAFNVRWELDLWGRIRSGRKAALAEVQASESDLRSAHLSLAGQVVKTWLLAAELRKQLELADQTVENYRVSARQVRERYEQGVRPSLDVRLSTSNLASAQALAALRRAEFQTVLRQLEILRGRYPAGEVLEGLDLPALPAEIPSGLPSDLLRRRPDLMAAERRVAAANARVREAIGGLFPRISLTGSAGRSSSELQDLLSSQFNVWAIAGNFLQPILEGGRLWGNVLLGRARTREAVENYFSRVLEAFGEVEISLASETFYKERVSELTKAAEQAVAAEKLAEERYQSGLEDFVTLLEAQRRALESQSQLFTAQRQLLENRVDLHLALGGGFTPPVSVEISNRTP